MERGHEVLIDHLQAGSVGGGGGGGLNFESEHYLNDLRQNKAACGD